MRKLVASMLVLSLACGTAFAQQQEVWEGKWTPPTLAERVVELARVIKVLNTRVNVKAMRKPTTLKDALYSLYDQLSAKGIELPTLIDLTAFREKLNGEQVYATKIQFAEGTSEVRLAWFLREALGRLPSKGTTFIFRPGWLEVTSIQRAGLAGVPGWLWIQWRSAQGVKPNEGTRTCSANSKNPGANVAWKTARGGLSQHNS